MSNSSLVSFTQISPNRTSPRTHKIDTITVHCYVGQVTVERIGKGFANPERRASCNYGIGYDGRICLICPEEDRSWCSSSSANDHRAITIEVASDSTHPYAVKPAAFESLILLLADICRRNNIPTLLWKGDKNLIGQVDKQNMTVHRWFANKSCPGKYLYDLHPTIADRVNALLAVTGDVNGDGSVNKKDLLALEKYLADSTYSIANGDVNEDGEVNKKDLLALKKILAGEGVIYKVQVGAFAFQKNAESLKEKLIKAGFSAYVAHEGLIYRVQVGAFAQIENAEALKEKLIKAGFKAVVKEYKVK